MEKKINFGIIGTGAIAEIHAKALKSITNAELVAVFDRDIERADKFAKTHKVKAVNNFDKFLDMPEIEAVTIATPTGIHGVVALPAAKAGKHILCEKPLDINLKKADEIIETCKNNNVTLAAVFQSRFSDAAQKIKKTIDSGQLGKMVLASTQIHWFRTQEYYDTANWRGTWAMDGGGALMNQAIHSIDLLLYFNGDPLEVFAYIDTLTHSGIEVEDTAVAIVKFKNGSLGTIEASTSCAPGFPRRIELSGANGTIVLEDDHIKKWSFAKESPKNEAIREACITEKDISNGSSDPMGIGHEGHKLQIEELVQSILCGYKQKSPGSEGRRAIQLLCGIYESARTGKPVRFK